jgi:hypothetical protein
MVVREAVNELGGNGVFVAYYAGDGTFVLEPGSVNPHSASIWKNDRYGPVVQELDFLGERPLTGAARWSGQCRGPALMEKRPRGATCALR